MTDTTCPRGDDCDLTTACLAGYEQGRDHALARIEQLEAQIGLARIEADQQRERATAAEAMAQPPEKEE